MANHYIYIDESGDPGIKPGSSSDFVIAAIVVITADDKDRLESAIDAYRRHLGWRDDEEFKFNKTNHKYIYGAIRATLAIDYRVYAMVLNKANINSGRVSISNSEQISLYVIKELLKEIALDNAAVIIDGAYGPKYITRARTYLRQQLNSHGIKTSAIHFVDSKKSTLIQLADLAAGSVAKSLSRDKRNKAFVEAFGKKLRRIYKL